MKKSLKHRKGTIGSCGRTSNRLGGRKDIPKKVISGLNLEIEEPGQKQKQKTVGTRIMDIDVSQWPHL